MTQLGNGLSAKQLEDALSVREAELSTLRRIGAPLSAILAAQGILRTRMDISDGLMRPYSCDGTFIPDV